MSNGVNLVRGPMGSDNYTMISNRILRGEVIPIRYVGIYCYIASHRWNVSEAQIARDLGVGRDFITSALRAMADAGLIAQRHADVDQAAREHGAERE